MSNGINEKIGPPSSTTSCLVDFCSAAQDHSYYAQQLSHLICINTDKQATKNVVDTALNDLLEQNSMLYTRDTDDLSSTQIAYLKAMANGVRTGFSTKSIIDRYGFSNSANITKAKKALIKKELIEERKGASYFLDPAYEFWFRKYILSLISLIIYHAAHSFSAQVNNETSHYNLRSHLRHRLPGMQL